MNHRYLAKVKSDLTLILRVSSLARNNAHPLKGEGTFIINECSSQFDLCKKPNESLIFSSKI